MNELKKFKKLWESVDRVIFGIVKHICVLMLGALVAIVFYIFVGRYFIHKSPMWGEPMSLFLLTWMSILGSSLVLRTDEHLKVTMFDGKGRPSCDGPACNRMYLCLCRVHVCVRQTADAAGQDQYHGRRQYSLCVDVPVPAGDRGPVYSGIDYTVDKEDW